MALGRAWEVRELEEGERGATGFSECDSEEVPTQGLAHRASRTAVGLGWAGRVSAGRLLGSPESLLLAWTLPL